MKTQEEKNLATRAPAPRDISAHDEQSSSLPIQLIFLLVVLGSALLFVAVKLFGIL